MRMTGFDKCNMAKPADPDIRNVQIQMFNLNISMRAHTVLLPLRHVCYVHMLDLNQLSVIQIITDIEEQHQTKRFQRCFFYFAPPLMYWS